MLWAMNVLYMLPHSLCIHRCIGHDLCLDSLFAQSSPSSLAFILFDSCSIVFHKSYGEVFGGDIPVSSSSPSLHAIWSVFVAMCFRRKFSMMDEHGQMYEYSIMSLSYFIAISLYQNNSIWLSRTFCSTTVS